MKKIEYTCDLCCLKAERKEISGINSSTLCDPDATPRHICHKCVLIVVKSHERYESREERAIAP